MKMWHHLLILFPVAVALSILSQENFLLFHAVIEFGSMAIFLFAVFLGFFATRLVSSPFLYRVSVTYFFLTVITFVHTLGYSGMGVFSQWNTNQPTQLWILGRYVHSIGIFLAVFLAEKKPPYRYFTIFLSVLSLGGIALVYFGLFPDCFTVERGLTSFKIVSEYIVSILFGLSIYLSMQRPLTKKRLTDYAFARSLLYFILGGLTFTLYLNVYSITNILGHMFYFLGAYILLTGFILPYSRELLDIHFLALNNKIRRLNRNLEDRVRKRTVELENIARQLEADVAKRKIVEDNLIKAQEEMGAAFKARSEFLATMSHEVRTPLTGILGIAEFLTEKTLSQGEQKKYLELVKTAGESLLEILNNILDLSKLEAGMQNMEIAPFSPGEVADSVKALFSCRADEKDIQLTSSVDPALPPVLLGDSLRLRQILFNLVGNAVKFTPRGEVSIEMKFSGWEGEKVLLTVSVRDTGIGISEEDGRKLFRPFTQSDGTITRRFGGTGLGLAICARTAELMGGTLDFDSRPEKGSVFFFTLPFTLSSGQQKILQEDLVGELPSALNILLAEDNPINRMILENFLRRDGWTVTSVENGIEAVERAGKDEFSLYILDIEMPDMDGYTAARHIQAIERERGGASPIIALSAHTTNEFRRRAVEAGMDFFLTKPVRKAELLKTLARVLSSLPEDEKLEPHSSAECR